MTTGSGGGDKRIDTRHIDAARPDDAQEFVIEVGELTTVKRLPIREVLGNYAVMPEDNAPRHTNSIFAMPASPCRGAHRRHALYDLSHLVQERN